MYLSKQRDRYDFLKTKIQPKGDESYHGKNAHYIALNHDADWLTTAQKSTARVQSDIQLLRTQRCL